MGRGVERDEHKAKHYWGLAAINVNVQAKNNIGATEWEADIYHRAINHYTLAAKAGDKVSLDTVKDRFMKVFFTKDEYANTLRAYQKQQDEMKSDIRDKAALYHAQ